MLNRYPQIDLMSEELRVFSEEILRKEPRVISLTESHEQDEDIGPHDGKDEPDAHPEPDPLGEEEGRP